MNRTFTQDWVTDKDLFWRTLLCDMIGKPGLHFLEIGSFEGRSACWWMDNILTDKTSHLTCVDPWPNRQTLATFLRNLGPLASRVLFYPEVSRTALPRLREGAYDFVYVDGSHEAADVLQDALNALWLLKRGGIMLFDDYLWDGKRYHHPKKGIDAFLTLNDWCTRVIHRGYQIAVMKTADQVPYGQQAAVSPGR